MEQKRQNKQKRRAAFTLAEFLTVIAIVGILASLSFVAVIHYQRKLRRLEMDQTAKEIFLAAQNHLTLEVSVGRFRVCSIWRHRGIFRRSKAGKAGNFGR